MTYTNFYHFINYCIHRYKLQLTHIDHEICWFTTGNPLYPINKKSTLQLLIDKARQEEFTGVTYDLGYRSNNCRINLQKWTTQEIIESIKEDIPLIIQVGFTQKKIGE